MQYYLSLDGGGTKLSALLFDEQARILAQAKSEGINATVYSEQARIDHITACYKALFQGLPRPLVIDRLWVVYGNVPMYLSCLPEGITVKETVFLGEGSAGLAAGRGITDGFCALSGTGSDIIYVRDGQQKDLLGGWGGIIGDEGSGAWIGRQAIQAAVRAVEGWPDVKSTCLVEKIRQKYALSRLREYIACLYATGAPFRALGELTPLVAEAAEEGDDVAINILQRAGRMMAKQQIAMLHRYPFPELPIVYCGGAWKTGALMRSAFEALVKEAYPGISFFLPRFEHVVAGPAFLWIGHGLSGDAVMNTLANLPDYQKYRWNADTDAAMA